MIRELKVRVQISDADYEAKLGHAIRFLQDNDQLKITVMFRGREITHPEIGERLLFDFVRDLDDYGKAELPPVREARQVFLVFTPKAVGNRSDVFRVPAD
jgi:translation initiation factor IF-3